MNSSCVPGIVTTLSEVVASLRMPSVFVADADGTITPIAISAASDFVYVEICIILLIILIILMSLVISRIS